MFYMGTQFSDIIMLSVFYFSQDVVENFQSESFNCCVIFHWKCDKFDKEFWCPWSLQNFQRKSLVRLIRVILLASLLDHIFQSIIRNHFIQLRTNGICSARRSSIPLESRNMWELLKFWPEVSVQNLIIIDWSACFNMEVLWTYHTNGLHSTPEWYRLLCHSCWWISLFAFLGRKYYSSWCFQVLRCEINIR